MKKRIFDQLVFTSDFHSNVPQGINFIESVLSEKKKSFVIDLGDFSEGNSFYEFSNGIVEKKVMEVIYDLIIPGNHGFNEILELERKKILNCNILQNNKIVFNKYRREKIGGRTVFLLGVMSEDVFYSIPNKYRLNYTIKNPKLVVSNLIKKIKRKNNLVILCSHGGLKSDLEKYSDLIGIDIILSSHCHSKGGDHSIIGKKIFMTDDRGRAYGKVFFGANGPCLQNCRINNKLRLFRKKRMLAFNILLDEYYNSCKSRIIFLNLSKKKIILDRKRLLKELIKKVINRRISCYAVNFTFIREITLNRFFSESDLIDLIPFKTIFLELKMSRDLFREFIDGIPKEIFEACNIRFDLLNNDIVNVLTTDYLYENFCAKKEDVSLVKRYCVREEVVELIKSI